MPRISMIRHCLVVIQASKSLFSFMDIIQADCTKLENLVLTDLSFVFLRMDDVGFFYHALKILLLKLDKFYLDIIFFHYPFLL